jgi:AraC family transcriptional regulator of arabinose operon
MSSGHYGMLFRKSRNHTPVDYFNRLKIQKACELLKTTDQPVGEIGESLGFTDPYYFSRLFKKTMGLSPRTYR